LLLTLLRSSTAAGVGTSLIDFPTNFFTNSSFVERGYNDVVAMIILLRLLNNERFGKTLKCTKQDDGYESTGWKAIEVTRLATAIFLCKAL
jgi:saccharopine dehydrogenase-like NADP-dependent oxidoreductase